MGGGDDIWGEQPVDLVGRLGGSVSKTSMPARPGRPLLSAANSAPFCKSSARDVLMKLAVGFMPSRSSCVMMPRVVGFRRTCRLMKSRAGKKDRTAFGHALTVGQSPRTPLVRGPPNHLHPKGPAHRQPRPVQCAHSHKAPKPALRRFAQRPFANGPP